MRKIQLLIKVLGLMVILAASSVFAIAQSDTGSITVSGSASTFVEVRSGGNATLTGNSGGSITSNKTKGDALGGMTIALGEVGPSNSNSFVKVVIPLRLRSNAAYALAMDATFSNTNTSSDAVQASDIGFGLSPTPSRTDTGVKSGTDVPVVSGDPSSDSDAVAGGRWNYSTGKSLADYSSGTSILSGPTIMDVIPAGENTSGLTLNTYFTIKPQIYAAGDFTSTITFTITAP